MESLGIFKIFNMPLARLLCAALASSYNDFSQVFCEFVDNAVSNLMGHPDDNTLVRVIRMVIRNVGEYVDITIEDGGTGIEDLDNAMTLCGTLHGDTPLNASGCGFKSSFAYVESNGGKWECCTRTREDAATDRYRFLTGPYDFGEGVFFGEYRSGWVGSLGDTGTVIHLLCPMSVFATLSPTTSEEVPSFQMLVNLLREHIRYTYSKILLDNVVTMELIVGELSDPLTSLTALTPIWAETFPKEIDVQTIDLGGGPVEIHCQYGNIQPNEDNLFYYRGNMESSGAEICINGRVIERGLLKKIWGKRVHPSQNGFLVRVDLVSNSLAAVPLTKAAKNGFREADRRLKKLFLWIRSNVELPEQVRESKEKQLLRKLEEKLRSNPDVTRVTAEMPVFCSIDLSVQLDLLAVRDNKIVIYEGKARQTTPLDIYQAKLYWDGCMKDGYPPEEAVLIGNCHSEDVVKLANELNKNEDGTFRVRLTTWKEEGITLT